VPLLPVTSADFSERIGNCAPSTWTAAPSTNETRPINCLNYFEAFLFCIWEGGRLPTEAEWIVAAAGGRQQRAYPWSYPPSDDTLTANAAVYGAPESRGPSDVGSVLAGSGRWGSQDLAGNLFEWTRDTVSGDRPSIYPPGASNPVYLDQDTTLRGLRAVHGGSYKFGPDYMRTPYRQWLGPEVRLNDVGFRCAYPGLNDN
jgi:formylglycine-generating enzyme